MMNSNKCCGNCRLFAELKTPYERSDGAAIYGYCFKDGEKDYSVNMGKGLPVFLPPTGGASCKAYKKNKTQNNMSKNII